MSKKTLLLISAAVILLGALFFLKYSPAGTALVWSASNGGVWLFPLVTVSALLDSINPCAFSVLLITIAFLFSLNRPRREVLLLGGSYIAGLFLVYLLIGLGILKALHIFNVPHFMGNVGALLIILFGVLNVLSHYYPDRTWLPGIPQSAHRKMGELLRRVSLPGVFLVGVLVGLCEFPCTGGPYLMILGLLHDNGTYLSGFAYLIYYNLLFVLPLAVMLIIASHKELLERADRWRKEETKKSKLWIGVAMVLLGLVIILLV